MLLPTTHIAFGALSAVFASLILKVKLTQTMFIGGMIFAFLPDFDYLFYLVRFGLRPAKYSHEHRLIWTHSLLPHFILSLIILLLWGKVWALIYFLASLSHLILDSLHSPWGVRWLWPFTRKYYSVSPQTGFNAFSEKQLDYYTSQRTKKEWVQRFVRKDNPHFIFESMVTLLFIGFLIFYILNIF